MKKISAFLLAAALIFTIVLGASIPAIQKNSAQLAAKMLSAEVRRRAALKARAAHGPAVS